MMKEMSEARFYIKQFRQSLLFLAFVVSLVAYCCEQSDKRATQKWLEHPTVTTCIAHAPTDRVQVVANKETK